MRDFLVNAVELATSKITEDFLEAEQQTEATRAAMQARKTMIEEDLRDDDGPVSVASSAGSGDGAGSAGLGVDVGGPDLTESLARLKARRAANEAQAEAAKHRGERERIERELDQIKQHLASVDRKLEDLPEQYRQMIKSCHETGELLWTRYLAGYRLGASKRGITDDGDGSDPDIDFEYPEVLDRGQGDPSPDGDDQRPVGSV
jgi:DNA repair exonuclease SbcCD ATPase subunit